MTYDDMKKTLRDFSEEYMRDFFCGMGIEGGRPEMIEFRRRLRAFAIENDLPWRIWSDIPFGMEESFHMANGYGLIQEELKPYEEIAKQDPYMTHERYEEMLLEVAAIK